jgi:hypothetical protein
MIVLAQRDLAGQKFHDALRQPAERARRPPARETHMATLRRIFEYY